MGCFGGVVEFVIGASNRQGYKQGEFVTKRERYEQEQEMEVVYDSRSKKYMIKISFMILRIQDFTNVTGKILQ